ncbi:MAG: ABC transporter ATP-binding protein [Verrucomicrobia bacterium]|nr:ABC transporter ATP-binding protein [Verrucomicrobiota bacterium]
MIRVDKLTKEYGGNLALDAVSFDVGKGEIVGLLGPNGAGKTTTLRILSCYLPATSGYASVAGHDVFSASEKVRKCIGYMPENNPLYPEMRVREYLQFRAKIKGLRGQNCDHRVNTVMEECGVADVHRKLIGHLSKGYRQRVGLADALVHEPDLIILDEPTQGLDPNQIRSVRELIKELGKAHTVLLSTHILSEVEMTCNRVLILHKGRILAADTPENLQAVMSDSSQVIAEIKAPLGRLRLELEDLPGVGYVDITASDGDYFRCSITPVGGADLREEVYRLARSEGWDLRELRRCRHSLEDIFIHITRRNGEEEE